MSWLRAHTLCKLGLHCARRHRVQKYDGGRLPQLCCHCRLIVGYAGRTFTKHLLIALVAALALAGCGAPAVTSPPDGLPGPNASIPGVPGTSWTIQGTSITGESFTNPQALAAALNCPVVPTPQQNGIPSDAQGLYCDITQGDPVMVVTFRSNADEEQEFGAYQQNDVCMLIGPGWILWDTQPNGTPPCDQAASVIGGTRADALP